MPAVEQKLSIEQLRALADFQWLTDDECLLLSHRVRPRQAAAGTLLFRAGDREGADLFLLRGTISLLADDGRERHIAADSAVARSPIARLRPRQYTARAVTPVSYLPVPQQLTTTLQRRAARRQRQLGGYAVAELAGDGGIAADIVTAVDSDLSNERLQLPTDNNITRLLLRPDQDAAQLAALLLADPASAALILRVANSPVFEDAGHCLSLLAAVDRLGTELVRHILRRRPGPQPTLAAELEQLRHGCALQSLRVAALAAVLAEYHGGFDAEEAALGGLLSGLGQLACLPYAQQVAGLAEAQTAARLTRQLAPQLGQRLAVQWELPASLTSCAAHWEQWTREHPGAADLCDLVQVATLQSYIGRPGQPAPPPFAEVPAWHRLALPDMSPVTAMNLVQAADARLQRLQQLVAQSEAA